MKAQKEDNYFIVSDANEDYWIDPIYESEDFEVGSGPDIEDESRLCPSVDNVYLLESDGSFREVEVSQEVKQKMNQALYDWACWG
jgi:hypothetical protein